MSRHKTRQSPWQSTCPTCRSTPRLPAVGLRPPACVTPTCLAGSESSPMGVLFGSSSDPRTHPPAVLLVSREPRLPGQSAQCAKQALGTARARQGRAGRGLRKGGRRVAIPAGRLPSRKIAYPPWRPSVPPCRGRGKGRGLPGVTIESFRPAPPRTAVRPHYDFTSL